MLPEGNITVESEQIVIYYPRTGQQLFYYTEFLQLQLDWQQWHQREIFTCEGNIRILARTWNPLTEVTSEGTITCEDNITW